MSEPTTRAGRDFVGRHRPGLSAWADGLDVPDRIAAVEAEARAAERERIEAKLAEMPAHEFIDTYEPGTLWRAVDLGAVLAIVREQAE